MTFARILVLPVDFAGVDDAAHALGAAARRLTCVDADAAQPAGDLPRGELHVPAFNLNGGIHPYAAANGPLISAQVKVALAAAIRPGDLDVGDEGPPGVARPCAPPHLAQAP